MSKFACTITNGMDLAYGDLAYMWGDGTTVEVVPNRGDVVSPIAECTPGTIWEGCAVRVEGDSVMYWEGDRDAIRLMELWEEYAEDPTEWMQWHDDVPARPIVVTVGRVTAWASPEVAHWWGNDADHVACQLEGLAADYAAWRRGDCCSLYIYGPDFEGYWSDLYIAADDVTLKIAAGYIG